MFYANDEKHNRVKIDDAVKGLNYYCPECEKLVKIVAGNQNAHHFRHFPNEACVDKWNYDMSEWHKGMQEQFDDQYREIVLERNGEKHRADILKDKTVIEFQHSPLSLKEFVERNEFYSDCDYRVVWVFDVSEAFHCGRLRRVGIKNNERKYSWDTPIRYITNGLKKETRNFPPVTICLSLGEENQEYCIERVTCLIRNLSSFVTEEKQIQICNDIDVTSLHSDDYLIEYDDHSINVESEEKGKKFYFAETVVPEETFYKNIKDNGEFHARFTNVAKLGFKKDDMKCPIERSKKSWMDINYCRDCEYCGGIENLKSNDRDTDCAYCYYPNIVNPENNYHSIQMYNHRLKLPNERSASKQ